MPVLRVFPDRSQPWRGLRLSARRATLAATNRNEDGKDIDRAIELIASGKANVARRFPWCGRWTKLRRPLSPPWPKTV